MRFHQLIPFLGLAFSFAPATPNPAQELRAVNQIVSLITNPQLAIKETPSLHAFAGQLAPGKLEKVIAREARKVYNSDSFTKPSPTAHLFHSIAAYHTTPVPERKAIYKDSIFSRILELNGDSERNKAQLDLLLHNAKQYGSSLIDKLNTRHPEAANDPNLQHALQIIHSGVEGKTIPHLTALDDLTPQNLNHLSVAEVNKALSKTVHLDVSPPELLVETPNHSNPSPEPFFAHNHLAPQPIVASA